MFNSQETSSLEMQEVKRENPSVKGKKMMENSGKMSSYHKKDYIQVQLSINARDEIMEVDAGTSVVKLGHSDVQINTHVLDQIQVGLNKTMIRESSGENDVLVNNDDMVHANIKVEIDAQADEDKMVNHFICDHCHVMYKSYKCFQIHKQICGELQEKIKSQKQQERRTVIKRLDKILCENCPKFFNSVDSYSAHKESHKEDNQSSQFLCDQCPTLCSSADSLKSHYASMHKDSCNIEENSWDSGPFENDESDETMKKEGFKLCSYDTDDKEDLDRHISTIHHRVKYYCDLCEYKASSKYSLTIHTQDAHEGTNERNTNEHVSNVHKRNGKIEKSFGCRLCDYKTKHKCHLSEHVRLVHEGERRFECSLCEFTAKRKSHLSEHTRVVHEGIIYECEKCDFQSKWKKNLRTHVASVHEGITHDCHLCHYKAAKRAQLIRHVSMVHETKPYECEECTFRTKCKQHLADHTASIHKGLIYSGKTENCDECGKLHLRGIKKKFSCIECGKHSKSYGELQVHMRVHTGEKPYVCTVCQKAFNKYCNLQVHTRIHTGEMPFQCQECGKRFRELFPLKKHMLKKHRIDYKPVTPNKRNIKKE